MRPVILLAAVLLAATSLGGGASAATGATGAGPDLPHWQELRRQSDWMALEKATRETLASQQRSNASPAEVATTTVWLADALAGEGRASEAEPLYRQALDTRQKLLGQTDPDTVDCMEGLTLALMAQDRYGEAEPLMRQAWTISTTTLKSDDPRLARAENILARLLRDRGYFADAEPHFRRALAIRQAALGPASPDTASSLNNLGLLLWSEGRFDEAEPLMRQALDARAAALGAGAADTALSLNGLALVLHSEGRYAEAEPLYRRALAVSEAAQGPSNPTAALILSDLGGLLSDQGRPADATPLFRRAVAIRTATLGADHPDTALAMNNLAFVLEAQGEHDEAEALLRKALAIDEKVLGDHQPDTAIVLRSIGEVYDDQGRPGEAEPLFRRAAKIDDATLGDKHPDTADAHQSLAYAEELQSRFADATGEYRLACDVRSKLAGDREQIGEAASAAKFKSSKCSTRLALALRGLAEQGGAARGLGPDALRDEAFVAAQHAALSAAGEAMARSAAMAAARSAGVGDAAAAFENALVERETLDQEFAKAAAETGKDGVEHRAALADRRAKVAARIEALAAELRAKAPRYWDLRAPDPIPIAVLQSGSGPDANLLKDDEALLMFLTPPGKDKGVVFAVSKTKAAWARIPLTGDELEAKVRAIRLPIEHNYRAFYRQPAYELYVALLGDPAIQAVISDKPTLLFVPAGPLTSLPPGLLVTRPPDGGSAGDSDQDALRATPWLLRTKAIALSPSVSSLRTLRQLERGSRTGPPDPLLAFADPDFSGTGAVPGSASAWAGSRLRVATSTTTAAATPSPTSCTAFRPSREPWWRARRWCRRSMGAREACCWGPRPPRPS
jgi:tetratricopeptide (TPR) repeat protein